MVNEFKDHIDIGYDMDLLIKPTSRVPLIGREYGFFTGPGNPLFSLGGGLLRSVLYQVLTRFHILHGYYVVETPIIARTTLYKLTGHLDFYRENMFLLDIEGDQYAIKPMNCPYHVLIFMNLVERFRNKIKLPFKVFELGKVHRYEISGALKGLMRVRGFTQDDAHLFTREKDIKELFLKVFGELKEIYEKLFHISITAETVKLRISLSDRSKIGEEFMGTREEWETAENNIMKVAEEIHRVYKVSYYAKEGEAAFYGPKLDVVALLPDPETGSMKEWQIGTMQFDFNLPRKFQLTKLLEETHGFSDLYMIHRALLGSIERFLGVYLEAYQGRLPFILAPVQVVVIGIKTGDEEVDSKILEFAEKIGEALRKMEIRTIVSSIDKPHLSGYVRKIRNLLHPPIIIYIGRREAESGKISVNLYDYNIRNYRKIMIEKIDDLEGVIDQAEKDIKELIGIAPRYPIQLDYLKI